MRFPRSSSRPRRRCRRLRWQWTGGRSPGIWRSPTAGVQARHRRQQASTRSIWRRSRADPRQSRPARQRQIAARNGRRDRVAGPAPDLRAARRWLSADVLIARMAPLARRRADDFLGSRGAFNFDLTVSLRDGAHHWATGAACWPIRTILANRLPRWSTRAALFWSGSSPRPIPVPSGPRWRASNRASPAVRRSIRLG